MKKFLAVFLVFVVCLAFAGCGGKEDESDTSQETAAGSDTSAETVDTSAEEDTILDITVDESTCFLDSGYLYYAFIATNPNDDCAFLLPSFRVTAYDAEGKVLATEERTFMYIYPGETIAMGNMLGESDAEPADWKVEVLEMDEYNIQKGDAIEHKNYTPIESSGVWLDGEDYVKGEIINNNDFDFDGVRVAAVFRDDDGNLLSVETGTVEDVGAGESVAFEIFLTAWDHISDNIEIFAYER